MSPLSKNIKKEWEFINNMTFVDLKYKKTLITNYNNNKYFLYHWDLISYIKNILTISDITQDFMLSFNNYIVYIFYNIIQFHIS